MVRADLVANQRHNSVLVVVTHDVPALAGHHRAVVRRRRVAVECVFCIGAHTATARQAYQDGPKVAAVLADLESAPVEDGLRATLRMLGKLTREGKVGAEDMRQVLSAGVSPQQVEDALAVCAAFNTTGRLAGAFGFEVLSPGASRQEPSTCSSGVTGSACSARRSGPLWPVWVMAPTCQYFALWRPRPVRHGGGGLGRRGCIAGNGDRGGLTRGLACRSSGGSGWALRPACGP